MTTSVQGIQVELDQEIVIGAPLSGTAEEHKCGELAKFWLRVKVEQASEASAQLRAIADAIDKKLAEL
jgi:hypothetical protein